MPLGSATANSSGAISATVTVPSDAVGVHPLLATGLSSTGVVRYLVKTVTVTTASVVNASTQAERVVATTKRRR